jgi:formylglycine-generating enzyme required for sulfatase activity
MAFCAWDNAYLPTEAEWNYAASGGDQQRAFPWSSPDPASVVLDVTRASYAVLDDTGTHCLGNGNPDCIASDLIRVGTKPAGDGRWGHSDLTGNVDEFVLDAAGNYPLPCKDCANIDYARTPIVLRGGNFSLPNVQSLRTTYRYYEPQYYRQYFMGFRCARKPRSGARTAMY